MAQFHYWERLKMLRLMSLQRRRERYTIIQMWKTHNGAAPNSTNIRFYHHQRLGIRAEVPTLYSGAQKSFSTKYFHSFTVRAARLWNTLPKEVNTAVTLDTFKVLLGRWLDHFPDNPPVKGYSTRNSNSIMNWVQLLGQGTTNGRLTVGRLLGTDEVTFVLYTGLLKSY